MGDGTHNFPEIRRSDIFRTFANRFARYKYLKHLCEDDHPVLIVESELVEIAKSKLQELVFTKISNDQRKVFKLLLESWIRAVAQERILGYDESDDVKEAVMISIQNESLASLFPQVH